MEDTQWNDVLRQKGIIGPKPVEAEVTEEQIEDMLDSVVKNYTTPSGSMWYYKLLQYLYYIFQTQSCNFT